MNKKTAFVLTALLVLTVPVVRAQDAAPAPSPWYIGFGSGLDVVGANWNSAYYFGGGGLAFGGLRMDPHFSLEADAEYWVFTGAGSSLTNPRFLALLKYSFEGKGLRPYLLAGPGFDLQFANPSGSSTANLDALAGIGLELGIGEQSCFFVEARYNFTLTQNTTLQDIPLLAGLSTSLP